MKYVLIAAIFLAGCQVQPQVKPQQAEELEIKTDYFQYKTTCRWVLQIDVEGEKYYAQVPAQLTCKRT